MARAAAHTGRVVAENRKARYNYTIEDTVETGIVLTGSEVKSLRAGRANIAESYARNEGGEIILVNAHISEFKQAGQFGHDVRRPRKLLLHKRQIARLTASVQRNGVTLVPLKLYFNDRGIAKLLLGLAVGKRQFDKRETQKPVSYTHLTLPTKRIV